MLGAYLGDYPNGAYAASAKGLLRRADWLSGDGNVMAEAYSQVVANTPVNDAGVAIANEVDLKLPRDAYMSARADVILVAVEDLAPDAAADRRQGRSRLPA